MNKKNIFIALSALFIYLGPAVTHAGDAPKAPHVVVESEVIDEATQAFEAADTNHDGELDSKEASHLPAWLKDTKPGNKGQISIIDAVNAAIKKFKEIAKTNGKFLTASEYKSLKGRE